MNINIRKQHKYVLNFLFTYHFNFFSGHIAERMSLRYFLTIGMLGSGLLTTAFGMGYFWNIHSFSYYVVVQVSQNGILLIVCFSSVYKLVGMG